MKKKNLKRMKVSPLFLFLILIPFFGSAAAPQVVSISQSNISDMQLLEPETGWILVTNELFWTDNNGIQWENISPNNGAVTAAYFIDPSAGFATTRTEQLNGVVTYSLNKTIDQGQSWESTEITSYSLDAPLASSQTMYVFFLNEQIGWVIFKQQTSSNFNIGTLFKTIDGGNTWIELSIPIGEPVFFINKLVGFTVGGLNDHHLYRTGDGGETWSMFDPSPDAVTKLRMPYFPSTGNGQAIAFEDASSIKIFETSNQGFDWTEIADQNFDTSGIDAPPAISFPGDTYIFTPTDRIVFDSQSKNFSVSPTSSQGVLTQVDGNTPDFLWGVTTESICTDANNPATCGIYDELAFSIDGGISWTAISTPVVQQSLPSIASFDVLPLANVIDYPRTSILRGQGFDICEIPTSAELGKWKTNSPYSAVNLYIGGVSRACDNTLLTLPGGDTFLQDLSIQGWKFIPTWVGHQAACSDFSKPMSYDLGAAKSQGWGNAFDAARVAMKLGLAAPDQSGTVIYYDLENFDPTNDPDCLEAAKVFINEWVKTLHSYGIMAGLYGSSCASHLSEFDTIANPPDVIWPAAWYAPYTYTSDASVFGVSCLSNTLWNQQERIRQYAGGHYEYWGGTPLNIDSNVIDGVVADISRYVGIPSSTLQNPSFETGTLSPWAINTDPGDCSWSIPNSTNARTGTFALSIAKSPVQTNCSGASQSLSLTPSMGDLYRFAIWARSTSPTDYRSVRLKISGSGGATESTNLKFSGIDDTWQCLEVAHTIQNSNLDQLTAEVLIEDTDGIAVLLDDAHMSLNTASLCPTVLLPTNLQASNGRNLDQVILTWDNVPDATYYKIFRSQSVTGDKFLIGQPVDNYFADFDGNPLDIYFYWVKACNPLKCSAYSDYDAGSFGSPLLNFSDNLEFGDFIYWPTIENPNNMYTCSNNAITGNYSACANATSSTPAYIQKNLVADTSRLSVSFDFDPNDAVLANREYTIMQAPTSTGVAFQLKIKYTAPNYQVWLEYYSGGTLVKSPNVVTIPNAPAHYQIDWNSSAVQARSINTFRRIKLTINNIEKISEQNIDNRGTLANSVLFGIIPNSTDNSGTNGVLIFDNFSFIGPQYLR